MVERRQLRPAARLVCAVAAASLVALGLSTRAAAQAVWKCVEAGGKPTYTNQEGETRGKNCVEVKREVLVVPSLRSRGAESSKGKAEARSPESPRAPRLAGPRARSGRAFGSGFVVSAGGDILTNAHLVGGCQALRVRANEEEMLAAAVIARDQENDLAVIRTERPLGPPAPLRAGAPLQTGESVWVLGFPLTGLLAPELNATQGIVSATAGVYGDPLKVQITNPIQIGNSGGPLLDEAGNVVGVVAGKLNAIKVLDLTGALPQNVNFAIKLDAVTQFLSAARVAFQRSSSRDPVAGVQLVRNARRYTVLIECQA
jgi:hypothetical protein